VSEAVAPEHVVERPRLEGRAQDEDMVRGERPDRGDDARERLSTLTDVLANVEMHLACRGHPVQLRGPGPRRLEGCVRQPTQPVAEVRHQAETFEAISSTRSSVAIGPPAAAAA
jgi:hypothetical protein